MRLRFAGVGRLHVEGNVRIVRPAGASVILGEGVFLSEGVRLVCSTAQSEIVLGDDCFINRSVTIAARSRIHIGRGTHIGWNASITDSDHHQLVGQVMTSPTTLGERVWIGAHAMILKGVSIGDGAVIGAGAIVTTDVPAGALALGSPAKVVRENVEWQR